MNITDEPMPEVAPIGSEVIFVLGRRDGEWNKEVILSYPGYREIDRAKHVAREFAFKGHEALVVVGKIIYRVWDRDKHTANPTHTNPKD
jgi:hypothetical protein